MARGDAKTSLLTRERAFEDAWIFQMRDVRLYSTADIARLTVVAAIRLADGSFSLDGGLGKALSERTVLWRLSELRDAVTEEFVKQPLERILYERHLELQRVMSMFAEEARISTGKARLDALAGYVRTQESERKLLGIDRPQQVEVKHTDDTGQADDRLVQAMKLAAERTAELKRQASRETSEGDA